jgi:hypothetical protein
MADLARDRLRLDRLMPQRLRSNFFPLRCAHSSRNKKSFPFDVLRCATTRARVRPRSSPALSIAIEAAVVAGSKTAKQEK